MQTGRFDCAKDPPRAILCTPMRERIEEILKRVRPALRMDGGDIELVDFDESTGVVRVRLQGACHGCPMSAITLRMGVEMALQEALPWVKEVTASATAEDVGIPGPAGRKIPAAE